MSVTVGTAIPAGQTWTINNCTSAVVTSKPAWLTTSVSISGNDCIVALSGTPDNSVSSFTIQASADNNNVPAGCTPAAPTTTVNSASVTVNCQIPTVSTTLSPTNATVGVAYTATIVFSNATSATVTNLPAWLSESFAGSTLTLTGTPAAGDVTAGLALTVNATNACGATSASATGLAGGTLVVSAGVPACTTPTIGTGLNPTTATVGVAYTATIQVNNATSGVSVTNLPGWLSQSVSYSAPNATITVTGTPAAGDVTAGLALTVDATNNPGGCTSASATNLAGGTLVVSNLPACTSPTIGATISVTSTNACVAYSATITVNNATTGVSVTNLPGWASQSVTYSAPNATITITGTPGVGDTGNTTFTVDATNNPGGCAQSSATGLGGGTLTVNANDCTTPTIGTTLNPTTATVGTAYTATIVVNNCTTASVSNLPAWLSESFSASAPNGTLTLTGTPAAGDITAGLALTVDATNAAAGCCSKSATGLAGGTLVVAAGGIPFGGMSCCGEFTINSYAYSPGDPVGPLPFTGTCGFTVSPCNDPAVAFALYSPYGFPDATTCQPSFSPPSGPFLPGYLFTNATKTTVVCDADAENAFSAFPGCPSTMCP